MIINFISLEGSVEKERKSHYLGMLALQTSPKDTHLKHTEIQLFTMIIKIQSMHKSNENAKLNGLGAKTK
jgi:hypothetical protein